MPIAKTLSRSPMTRQMESPCSESADALIGRPLSESDCDRKDIDIVVRSEERLLRYENGYRKKDNA